MIWFCLLMSFITKGSSDIAMRYHCENYNTYTPNSTYKAKLHSLISILSSHNTRANNGFYQTTVAPSAAAVPTTPCTARSCAEATSPRTTGRICVGGAGKTILELCTNGTTAMICSYSASNWSIPREPAFYRGGSEKISRKIDLDQSMTANELSISELCPR
nr:cysteine-rich receptor-like protein kinase 10 [Ipomoea trifida]